MAKQADPADVVEELPSEAKPAPAAKGGNPWLPIVVVIVLLPVLSFALMEFVMLPKLRKELSGGTEEAAEEHAAPAAKKEGHGESKASGHGEAKSSGHGEGGGNAQMYEFETLKTNLSRPPSTLIIVKFTVRGSGANFATKVADNRDKLIDATLKILSLLTLVDTQTPGIQNTVKTDLIASFNEVLGEPLIENLFFVDFVTQ